jgi:hypothetical protein
MVRLGIFCIVLLFSSCSREQIMQYSYNGFTVERVDKSGETTLRLIEAPPGIDLCADHEMRFEYYGRDGIFTAFLIFEEDKVFVYEMNSYAKIKTPCDVFVVQEKLGVVGYGNWKESIKDNFDNVIEIMSYTDLEERNRHQDKSNVKVKYINFEPDYLPPLNISR